jgi:DNA modification methylase
MVVILNSVQLIKPSRKVSSDLLSWSTLDNSTMARWLVSVWDIAKTKDEKRLGVPTITPLELINRLIIMYSKVGDVVLDPFMGTGSTVVSAYMLIRKGIGFEIYKPLIDLAARRLSEVEEMRGPQPLSLPDALTLEMDALRRDVDHESGARDR